MKTITSILAVFSFLVIAGCSTSASFKLPPNTGLLIKGEKVSFETATDADGYPVLNTRPFFWDAAVDISYSLIQNDKVIKEGKLPAQFRIVSIFWPPYSIIYWPFGFKLDCYDLTKEFVEECLTNKPELVPPAVLN